MAGNRNRPFSDSKKWWAGKKNANNYYWELDEVHKALDKKMTGAFQSVWETHKQRDISVRMAAYVVAVGRLAKAVRLRGLVK